MPLLRQLAPLPVGSLSIAILILLARGDGNNGSIFDGSDASLAMTASSDLSAVSSSAAAAMSVAL